MGVKKGSGEADKTDCEETESVNPVNLVPVSTEGKEEVNEVVLVKASPAIVVDPGEKGEELRCDSRTSQRSLSPLSVGPVPSPLDPSAAEEKAQETFARLYEAHVTSTNTE